MYLVCAGVLVQRNSFYAVVMLVFSIQHHKTTPTCPTSTAIDTHNTAISMVQPVEWVRAVCARLGGKVVVALT